MPTIKVAVATFTPSTARGYRVSVLTGFSTPNQMASAIGMYKYQSTPGNIAHVVSPLEA